MTNNLRLSILLLILLGFTGSNIYGQTLNLSDYELVAGPITVGGISADLSGVTYNPLTNTLFMITNKNSKITETTLTGGFIRSITLNQFGDPEGIAHIEGNNFAITEERLGRVLYISIHDSTSSLNLSNMNYTQLPGIFNNEGLEGVTYNSNTGDYYAVKEKNPRTLFRYNGTATAPNLLLACDIQANSFGMSDVSDIFHLAIPVGLNDLDVSDKMLILSDESNKVVEIDDNCNLYSTLNLPTSYSGGGTQHEGVTMDNDGNIYIVGEPNVLYVYSNTNLVLPGDFNNDSIADGRDLLYWGLSYGNTGFIRPNATTDWIPQGSPNWTTSVNNVNSKHQDANGDGIIDTLDLEVLEANYGETYGNIPFTHESNDAMFVIESLDLDDVTNQIRFDVNIVSDIPVITHGISASIDISALNYYDFEVDTVGSSLHPDAYIYNDNDGIIEITLTRTDKSDQIIDGTIVSLVVMVKDIQSLVVPPINTIGGYIMSAAEELTSIGGSTLHGRIAAPVSLGVNHVYCEEKGMAEVYVKDAPVYNCTWSTGATTASIDDLDMGSYSVTVSDGIDVITTIDFDITWAFTPVDIIDTDNNEVYIDFEEAPLSEDVEISLDGGLSYMSPTIESVEYSLSNGNYQMLIRRIPNECSTYLVDVSTSLDNTSFNKDFSVQLNNSLGEIPRLFYQLDSYGTVDIHLYNIHGQQLRTLHNSRSTAGEYQIDIDKSNLSEGIYFIHFRYESDGYNHCKTLKILI